MHSLSLADFLPLVAIALCLFPTVHSFTSYANDFVDPQYILSKSFNSDTSEAQQTIFAWAEESASYGPWTVMNKTITPPSGDLHDYMSWAPYSWPNCTGVGNTTALTEEQIWVTCPYYTRDGQFNPDGRLVDDVGAFGNMSDAVFYNAIAWGINGSSVYSSNVARFIDTWFINNDTIMNPNLNYAQMARGPDGQTGQHEGVLDLKCMSKVVSAVLILREGNATEWTPELDSGLNAWTTNYINWLETAKIAIEEEEATNNHGSYYFNQLASLQILVNDLTSANNTIAKYFSGIYMNQISANGDQPLESARTRPYHYRSYNLAAMITNAKLEDYIVSRTSSQNASTFPGYGWHHKTTNGTTIQDALNYAITKPPGTETASELWPDVVAVGAAYGDANGSYAKFLLQNAGQTYPADAQFLWNQPFSDSGIVAANANSSSTTTGPSTPGPSGDKKASSACLGTSAQLWFAFCSLASSLAVISF